MGKIKRDEVTQRENKYLNSKNSNVFWKFINRKMSSKGAIPALRTENENIISDTTEKCNLFKSYFSSIYQNDNGEQPVIEQYTQNSFCHIDFSPEIVYAYLHDLPNKFTLGPDGLNQFFFKQLAFELALPLSIIFQKSFLLHTLPSDWLTANVIPIHKGGDKALVTNYRPISLTSIACKIMESMVKAALLK